MAAEYKVGQEVFLGWDETFGEINPYSLGKVVKVLKHSETGTYAYVTDQSPEGTMVLEENLLGQDDVDNIG